MDVKGFTARYEVVCSRTCRGIAIARVLITVAIIAIVGTVALPISRDHLDSTHEAQVVADLGAIEIAIARYKASHRGELPMQLTDLRVGGWVDPWGNRYQYSNLEVNTAASGAQRDYDGNQLNRDYDLFSLGKDGRTGPSLGSPSSQDNVIRGLNGNFFGSAAEYPGR